MLLGFGDPAIAICITSMAILYLYYTSHYKPILYLYDTLQNLARPPSLTLYWVGYW